MRGSRIGLALLASLALTLSGCGPSIADVEKQAMDALNHDNAGNNIHVKSIHLESIGNKEYRGTFVSQESDGETTYNVRVKYDGDQISATPEITLDGLKNKIKRSYEANNGPKVESIEMTKSGDTTYTGTIALQEPAGTFTYDVAANAPQGGAITWKLTDTKDTLTRKVRADIQANLANQDITVTDLTLVKLSDHEYSGLLQTIQPGGMFKDDVHVEVDDNTFKWKIGSST